MAGVIYDLQGHVLLRRIRTTPLPGGNLGGRGQISGFSRSSAARMRRYLRTCEAEYSVLLTLTYPAEFPTDGGACKEHLRRFFARCRRYAADDATARQDFSAFWFVEFQERGAPHFHILTNREFPKDWISTAWYECVGSGDARHLAAGTRIERIRSGRHGTCAYATKYANKQDQKVVPHDFHSVGRFWGICGLRRCVSATMFIPAEIVKDPIIQRFHAEIRGVLIRNQAKIRKMKLSGWSAGFYLQDTAVKRQILTIFYRYAPFVVLLGGSVELPTADVPFEP